MIKKNKACKKINFSSNVNEVIRAVLNSLFFLRKDFTCTKSTKSTKTEPSESTKRYKQTKIKNVPKKTSKRKKVTYLPICVFVPFVHAKKRKQKKGKSPYNVNVLNIDVPTTRFM